MTESLTNTPVAQDFLAPGWAHRGPLGIRLAAERVDGGAVIAVFVIDGALGLLGKLAAPVPGLGLRPHGGEFVGQGVYQHGRGGEAALTGVVGILKIFVIGLVALPMDAVLATFF